MLGSANVFGNPINFFRTLNSGIWDFVSAPTQSVHQVHITFLEPIGSWWLWPSCMAKLVGIAPGVWSCCIVSTQQFHISNQILIVEPQCLKMIWKWNFHSMVCVAMLFFLYRIWRFCSSSGTFQHGQCQPKPRLCWTESFWGCLMAIAF